MPETTVFIKLLEVLPSWMVFIVILMGLILGSAVLISRSVGGKLLDLVNGNSELKKLLVQNKETCGLLSNKQDLLARNQYQLQQTMDEHTRKLNTLENKVHRDILLNDMLPLGERLEAGRAYLDNGGNGLAKRVYEQLEETA